jgi:thiol-disulfide isomerase/thioredoxin
LGFYTPIIKKPSDPVVKDTVSKHSNILYVLGDSVIPVDRGKFYLFDYWYLSCVPCLEMMPFMNKLHHKADTGKLIIIGVNTYDSEANISQYLNKRGYSFIQLDILKNRPFHRINEHPTLILLDGNFNEIKRFKGYGKDITEKQILAFLKSRGLLRE